MAVKRTRSGLYVGSSGGGISPSGGEDEGENEGERRRREIRLERTNEEEKRDRI